MLRHFEFASWQFAGVLIEPDGGPEPYELSARAVEEAGEIGMRDFQQN